MWCYKINEWKKRSRKWKRTSNESKKQQLPRNHCRMAVGKLISIRGLSTDLRPLYALSGQETTMGSTELGHIGALMVAEADNSPKNARTGILGREGDRTIKDSVLSCGHFKLSREERQSHPIPITTAPAVATPEAFHSDNSFCTKAEAS